MGLTFRKGPYRCPDCGRQVIITIEVTIHAATCIRSGAIGRHHTGQG